MNRTSLKFTAAVLTAGCFLIIVIGRIVNDDIYHLNKTARLISMRMSQIDMLSFRRKQEYRIVFYKNRYTIGFRVRSEWMHMDTHSYSRTVHSTLDGLEVRLRNGLISEIWFKNRLIQSKRPAVFQLYYPHDPEKRRSILIDKKKGWQILD